MTNDSGNFQERNRQRADELKRVPIHETDKSKWPKNVRPVAVEELDVIGVDKNGLLYWDGKPIIQKVFLGGFWEFLFAALVAVSTFGTFLIELYQAMKQ